MILQALNQYYNRKKIDPEANMAPKGFEWKEMPYILILKSDGTPVNLVCTYEGDGKKRRAKQFLVPQAVKKTSGITANLFWDNPEYALGIDPKGKQEKVAEKHNSFRKRIDELGASCDEGLSAVQEFLKRDSKEEDLTRLGETWTQYLKDGVKGGGNLTFQLLGDTNLVLERPAVRKLLAGLDTNLDASDQAICLISGEKEKIERLHSSIKGVWGSQSSGANIVSFNLDSFSSYAKKQGANAPVGVTAAFAYTTALNHLLGKDSRQRMQVGDASTVFWAERETNKEFERQFLDFFSEPSKDSPDRGTAAVESLFRSIENGTYLVDEGNKSQFYVLGLAPNASRISVRFWIVDTVFGMGQKICHHFEDIRMIHGPRERPILSLFRLLVSTAVQGKSENIPPNIAGSTMRSILEGIPYPQSLMQSVIRRIRAEHEVTYPRAALIKACLNRAARFDKSCNKEELKMSLDESNKNIGYRLGRLFAALEKIQQDANPGINATIRDRFYGGASGTPITVFGNLMRLKNHHLAKLENPGRRIYFEKILGGIMEGIDAITAFPPHLSLDDQGRFAIGYYHQMQDFYSKKSDKNESN
jgi:CRISPR-associated protein Csd1